MKKEIKVIIDTDEARNGLFLNANYAALHKDSDEEIAEKALHTVVPSAVQLYNRSLWEKGDVVILSDAQHFLKANRDKILAGNKTIGIRLYYSVPEVYNFIRRVKYVIGNMVKYVKSKVK